jgi:hypothetical protein
LRDHIWPIFQIDCDAQKMPHTGGGRHLEDVLQLSTERPKIQTVKMAVRINEHRT